MTRKIVLTGMMLTTAAISVAITVALAQPAGGPDGGQPQGQGQMQPGQGQQPGGMQGQQPGMPPRMQKQGKGGQGFEEMGMFIGVIDKMRGVCYNPEVAAMVAAGGLKDEIKRKPGEAAKDLEDLLAKAKTVGLRTAIRMTLKDIFKEAGDDAKVVEQLKAIVQENDDEMQTRIADRKKMIEADIKK
ncbi:MAG: hypothetical protein HZA50_00280 [Planctomycetes bacterium]|nr:hypothetical protein [Planctomycetota bacterium]